MIVQFADECLLLADDFSQYYLGAFSRTPIAAAGVVATAGPIAGQEFPFGGPAVADNPVDEAGAFVVTSDVLPPAQFPQFASEGVAEYLDAAGPFIPVEGRYAMLAPHSDDGYMRLARSFDLTGVSAAQAPTLEAQLSFSTEPDYDHIIVEAHTVGARRLDDPRRRERRHDDRCAGGVRGRASWSTSTRT